MIVAHNKNEMFLCLNTGKKDFSVAKIAKKLHSTKETKQNFLCTTKKTWKKV